VDRIIDAVGQLEIYGRFFRGLAAFDNDDNDDSTPPQYIQAPSLSLNGSAMPDQSGNPLLQSFKNGIAKVENAAYTEGNKFSSAFGKYQFTAPTLEAVREQHFPNIPKKDFVDTYKSDGKFQERVMDAYSSHLLSKYPDPHQAATAFFLGEGKANYYNQPNYRPTPNNLTVGKYLQNFDSGYKRQGGHIMNKPEQIDLNFADGGETGPGPKSTINLQNIMASKNSGYNSTTILDNINRTLTTGKISKTGDQNND